MSAKSVERLPLDAATWPLVRRFAALYLRRYPGRLALATALMAVVALTTGYYPMLIERAYTMFEAGNMTLAVVVPLAILGMTVLKGVAAYAQNIVTTALVERVLADVRATLFRHLVRADFATLHRAGSAELASRFLTDIDLIRNALSRVLNNLVRDVLTVVALVGSMLWLDWQLACVFVAIYPLAAVPVTRLGKRLRRLAKATQTQVGGMMKLLAESLGGVRMVKTYALEDYERGRGRRVFEDNYALNMAAIRQRAALEPILEVLGGVVVAGIIAFAGWRIAHGGGSAGAFTGFIGALMMAAQPVRAIGTLNSVLQEGLAAVQRVFAVVDAAPAVRDRADAQPLQSPRGEVVFDNVAFHYGDDDETPALRGISFSARPGEMVALVGRSGAGKSTVISLLPRLWDVTGGRILLDGHDIRDLTLASLRASMALVSQDSILFDDTVAANIGFGQPGADRGAVEAAARAAAADGFIGKWPQGYDTPVGAEGNRLSGGQRQRVALARAFLKDAPILLLDEATSALDTESERLVQDALEQLRRGRTTLVVAHRLSTVRHADRILVMDDGLIVDTGRHEELLARDGLYRQLCRLQMIEG